MKDEDLHFLGLGPFSRLSALRSIQVKAPDLAEAAVDLPWLAPGAGSLAALVRLPAASVWASVRGDPGLVLLWARSRGVNASSFAADELHQPALLNSALQFLALPAFVDWNHPTLFPVYRTCYLQAAVAHALAEKNGQCDPFRAWIGGLLAPLGWLAACAVDQRLVDECRRHPDFTHDPAGVQRELWGLDHTAIARRLCRRWQLPSWLAAVIGQLGLPAEIAQTLGADGTIFRIVQLAAGLVQQRGEGLGLVMGAFPADLSAALNLDENIVEVACQQSTHLAYSLPRFPPWQAPSALPLLGDYLRLALKQGGPPDEPVLERLQMEVDQLHGVLEAHCAGENERLRDLKLRALGELAAGAGHEINNPLAVISGQAQYLIGRESDPERSKALHVIIGQTKRIHQILTELMAFARPAAPQKQYVALADLVRDVVEPLREMAERLQVRLMCPAGPALDGGLFVDPAQTRAALGALMRNAIEAAPEQGWAGIRVEGVGSGAVEFIIEDNGAGPTPAAREHMFDPFFCGRTAGRGRGLGLTTAWRLAQLQGGNVRFEQALDVTRFVLHLDLVEMPPEQNLPESLPLNVPIGIVSQAG